MEIIYRRLITFFFITICFGRFLAAQTTVTLSPHKDALLSNQVQSGVIYADRNFGTDKAIRAWAWTSQGVAFQNRSLIEFDLSSIPANAIIQGAKLILYGLNHQGLNGKSNASYFQRVTGSWEENTVTWNNQPSVTTLNQISLSHTSVATQNDTLNITSHVQEMLINPNTNMGFMLRLQDEIYYASREYASSDHETASLRPKLIITYSVPVTITIQPNAICGKDATVWSLDGNNNNGNGALLNSMAWTWSGVIGTVRGVMDFDLSKIPSGASIDKAYLSLYVTPTPQQHSGDNASYLKRITSSWEENTVIWSNQPSTTTLNQVLLPTSTSATQHYENIDVKNLIQDMRNNPTTSFGLMLQLVTEVRFRRMGFASSDEANSALHPKLVITYITSSAPSYVVNLGNDACIGQGETLLLDASKPNSTYLWQNGSTNSTFTVTQQGTYWVQVTDINNCVSTRDTIEVNSLFVSAGSDKSRCSGSTESVTIGGSPTASGGDGNYTYSWSPATGLSSTNVANPTATPGVSTTYTVTVTSASCTKTDNVVVNVIDLFAQAGSNQSYCPGNDSITIGGSPTASGGNGTYTYSWSPATGLSSTNVANPKLKPAAPTTYTVTVTSASCTRTDDVFIDVLSNLVVQAGPDHSYCPGNDSLTIGGSPTASGGNGTYTYSWSPSTGLSSTTVANPKLKPSASATYTVTVTSGTCTRTDNVLVNVLNNLVVQAGPDHSYCPGNDSLIIGGNPTASGGNDTYTYSWSPSTGLSSTTVANPKLKPSASTTYTVTVTSGTCTRTDNVLVNVLNNLVVQAGSDHSYCPGNDSLTIGGSPTASGGNGTYTYSWSPSTGLSSSNIANPKLKPSTPTTYTVTVTSGTCTRTDNVLVNVLNDLVAQAGPDHSYCPGNDSISIGGSPTASGGNGLYTYSWSPSTGLSSTTIANPKLKPSAPTTYTVTVTSGSCTRTDSVFVDVLNNLIVQGGPDHSYCPGNDSITIGGSPTASGGNGLYTYSWSPSTGLSSTTIANPKLKPSAPTTYTVTVTSGSCTRTDSVFVDVLNNLIVQGGPDHSYCPGNDSITIGGSPTASGGNGLYTYSWSPSTGLSSSNIANPKLKPSAPTTYTVTITSGSCTRTDSVFVDVLNSLIVQGGPDHSYCPGNDSITIGGSPTASGGNGLYTYSWSPSTGLSSTTIANPKLKPSASTTYTVTVTSGSCTRTDNVLVNVLNNLIVQAGPDYSYCPGNDSLIIGGSPTASGGNGTFAYSWSPSTGLSSTTVANPKLKPSTSTTYTVTVTSGTCTRTDNVLVDILDDLIVQAGLDQIVCTANNDSVTIGGTPTASGGNGIYTYSWSPTIGLNSATIANPNARPPGSTTYTLTVTSSSCTRTDNVFIDVDIDGNQCINSASLFNVGPGYDFPTIAEAIAFLNGKKILDSLVFRIREGSYSGNFILDSSIVFKKHDSVPVFFVGEMMDSIFKVTINATNETEFIKLNNKYNFSFLNLKFTGRSTTAVRILNSGNVNLENLDFENVQPDVAVYAENSSNLNFENLFINFCTRGFQIKNGTERLIFNNINIESINSAIEIESHIGEITVNSNKLHSTSREAGPLLNFSQLNGRLAIEGNEIAAHNKAVKMDIVKSNCFFTGNSISSGSNSIDISSDIFGDTLLFSRNEFRSEGNVFKIKETDALSSNLPQLILHENNITRADTAIFVDIIKANVEVIKNRLSNTNTGIVTNPQRQNNGNITIAGNFTSSINSSMNIAHANKADIRMNTFVSKGMSQTMIFKDCDSINLVGNNAVNEIDAIVVQFAGTAPSSITTSSNNWFSFVSTDVSNQPSFIFSSTDLKLDPKFNREDNNLYEYYALSYQSPLLDKQASCTGAPFYEELLFEDLGGNLRMELFDIGAFETPSTAWDGAQIKIVLEDNMAFTAGGTNGYASFLIEGLNNFTNVLLSIYGLSEDGTEELVYQSSSKTTFWTGIKMNTGTFVEEGVYRYVLTLDNKNLAGFVYVKR